MPGSILQPFQAVIAAMTLLFRTLVRDGPASAACAAFCVLSAGAMVAAHTQEDLGADAGIRKSGSVQISYADTGIGTVLTAQKSATLKVRTFMYSGNEDSPIGARAGAGIVLSLTDAPIGVTDSAGETTLVVPADAQSISAQRPPSTVGTAKLDLMAGQENSVDIIMSDDGEVYAEGEPRIDEVRGMLLPAAFTSFTGRVTDLRGNTIKIAQLASVDAYDPAGMPLDSLTSMFALGVDGTFHSTDVTALRNLFNAQAGRITLTIRGIDGADNVYVGNVSFYLSSHPVGGRLTAPASFPGLRLDGIRVVGKMLGTEIVVSTVTDAGGRFAFPDLPAGNLSIAVETLQSDRNYYGWGVHALAGPAELVIRLSTAAEDMGANMSVTPAPPQPRPRRGP